MVLDEDEPIRYRCGSGFISVPFDTAKERVEEELSEQKNRLKQTEASHGEASTKLAALKRTVGDKFGDAVRLD
jgi:chaperonin cofactor prefoldin